MRIKIYAALCAASFAICVSAGAAKAGGCFVGYGYGSSPCYPAPVVYGPPAWAERAYDVSPYVYYPLPVERQQLVRPYEFSHPGWDIYATYGMGAYAAADEGCYLLKMPDWHGGWVWGMRAGCF